MHTVPVSTLTIRRRIGRARCHSVAVTVVLALGLAVAIHHAGVAMGSMDHGMHDDGPLTAMAMCAGALVAVGAVVVAVALGMVALGGCRPVSLHIASPRPMALALPEPRARAGPLLLIFLCRSLR